VQAGGQKRRSRKKRGRMDMEVSFEAILQRTEELKIRDSDRLECKVEEGWIDRMRKQATTYCKHTN
jgi:predicted glycoside hydrolase/deacetylase ChbG (UPF0249 family)